MSDSRNFFPLGGLLFLFFSFFLFGSSVSISSYPLSNPVPRKGCSIDGEPVRLKREGREGNKAFG